MSAPVVRGVVSFVDAVSDMDRRNIHLAMKTTRTSTPLHRLLHWTMALAMTVLLITGFLRMYWMNRRHITSILEAEGAGLLSPEQARAVSKAILSPMWEWHVHFAKVMVIAFILRLVYMVVKGIRFPNPFRAGTPLKQRLQGLTYVYFYAFVLVSAFTGACIHLGLLKPWEDTIEAVHKWGIWWFPVFILLHIAGVFVAEHSQRHGITSRMIGGDRD